MCLQAQTIEEARISGDFRDRLLEQIILDVETDTPIKFYFENSWLYGITVTGRYVDYPLADFIRESMAETGLEVIFYDDYNVVFRKDPTVNFFGSSVDDGSPLYVVGDSSQLILGREVKVTGLVREAKSGQTITGVAIKVEELNLATVSNTDGVYTFTLPTGEYHFIYDYLGLDDERFRVRVYSAGKLDVELYEDPLELQEVTITGEAEDINITRTQMGVTQVSVSTLNKLPAFMGEVDVVKSLVLLPGVSTVGEGTSGLNVRGGSSDQNLLLFDNAPVYNPSHVFGFFSIFNSSTVENVTLYKSSVPARFGGRLSSVMDISHQAGDKEKFHGSGGIGMVASRLALQIPVAKERTSVFLSGRISYLDYILNRIDEQEIQNSSASFWDASARIDHDFKDGSKLSGMGYFSDDQFSFRDDTLISWNNVASSIKYSRLISNRTAAVFSGIFSKYQYSISDSDPVEAFNMDYDINHYGLNADFATSIKNHNLEFGFNGVFYHFQPGELTPTSEFSSFNPRKIDNERSLETALYLGDEIFLSPKLSLNAGLRVSVFTNLGPSVVNIYQEDEPRDPNTVIDSLVFGPGEPVSTYWGAEPRLSFRYQLDENSAIKVGYNRMRQYIHLISNTAAVTPFDIWKSSDWHLQPQIGDQFSAGYFRNFFNNVLEASIEGYYKMSDNITDFKDGAQLLLNPNIETDLLQGEGQAYGIEVLLKKQKGRLNGWASYTWSRSFITVDSELPENRINQGNRYPTSFDKPHDFTFVLSYRLSRRWTFSTNFTYNTGRPVTAPESRFSFNGIGVSNFVERNGFRIPDYHRLDLSLTVDTNLKKNKVWEGSWTFAVYNVYSRDNTYSVYFQNQENGPPQAFRLSILTRAFPSITYNFKF